MSRTQTPLIYSCSGCSNLAQLANTLAVRLDRAGIAEMSCIAGVGGDVKSLVKIAQSARPILAIDGCHLHCVKACLGRHAVEPAQHITLSDFGLRKRYGEDCSTEQADELFTELSDLITSDNFAKQA